MHRSHGYSPEHCTQQVSDGADDGRRAKSTLVFRFLHTEHAVDVFFLVGISRPCEGAVEPSVMALGWELAERLSLESERLSMVAARQRGSAAALRVCHVIPTTAADATFMPGSLRQLPSFGYQGTLTAVAQVDESPSKLGLGKWFGHPGFLFHALEHSLPLCIIGQRLRTTLERTNLQSYLLQANEA